VCVCWGGSLALKLLRGHIAHLRQEGQCATLLLPDAGAQEYGVKAMDFYCFKGFATKVCACVFVCVYKCARVCVCARVCMQVSVYVYMRE
jgi:hypothetical protein